MSKPSPGDYRIINTTQSSDGDNLVITFTNEGDPLLVAPGFDPYSDDYTRQVWTVQNYSDGRTQSISPKTRPDLQVGFGSEGRTFVTLPAGGYVWTIRGDGEKYIIEDGHRTVFWALNNFFAGEDVSYVDKQGDVMEQEWVFDRVDAA